MSSAVFVESPATINVGDVALNRAETNPAAFIPSPKRVGGQGMVHVNGYDIPASLPVAAVLHTVIGRATAAHRDQAPSHLVLTHPEGWSPREVGVLLDAAARVGYGSGHVSTVSEPPAAAHYYSRTETMPAGTKIAVFDIIAARGDNSLGGKNLDAGLREWVDHMLNDRIPTCCTSSAPPRPCTSPVASTTPSNEPRNCSLRARQRRSPSMETDIRRHCQSHARNSNPSSRQRSIAQSR